MIDGIAAGEEHGNMFIPDPTNTPVTPTVPDVPASEPVVEPIVPQEPAIQLDADPEEQKIIDNLWPDGDPSATPDDKTKQRFEYWQGKHDSGLSALNKTLGSDFKTIDEAVQFLGENDVTALRQQNEDLQLYAPVAKYLKDNPDALGYLEERLKGQPQVPTQPQQSAEPELKMPVKPTRPTEFNPEEIHIKGTSSYDYAEAKEKYLEDMYAYSTDTQERANQKMMTQFEEQERVANAKTQYASEVSELTNKHKMLPDEIRRFHQFINKGGSNLGDMVDYFRYKEGAANVQTQQFLDKQQRLNIPTPITGAPSIPQRQFSEQDEFSLDLLQKGKDPYSY